MHVPSLHTKQRLATLALGANLLPSSPSPLLSLSPSRSFRYLNCTRLDPDRADAWFYLGQHYRLVNDAETAIKYLKKAASMAVPQRSLFQWHYLYQCLSKIEYGRALVRSYACVYRLLPFCLFIFEIIEIFISCLHV